MKSRRIRASLDAGTLGAVPVTVTMQRGRITALWPMRAELDEADPTQAELAHLVDGLACKMARAHRQGASLAELARRAELAHRMLAQLADLETEQAAP